MFKLIKYEYRRNLATIAVMLSAYPTKHARIGNAVGLDTPVSAVRVLREMRAQGYHLGDRNQVVEILDRADATGDDTEAGEVAGQLVAIEGDWCGDGDSHARGVLR